MKKRFICAAALGMSLVLLSGCFLKPRNITSLATPELSEEPVVYESEMPGPDETEPESEEWTKPNVGTGADAGLGTDAGTGLGSDGGNTTVNPSNLTASYLSDEAENIMKSLPSDYNKILWGVRYTPGDMEGLVVSVAEFADKYGSYYLLVGYTNIYSEDITVSASGYAKGTTGQEIGNIYTYVDALGPGNTYVQKVYCSSDIPSGEIHWDSIETKDPTGKSSVYWEADYQGGNSGGELVVAYDIQTQEPANCNEVSIVIVDENGIILDYGKDVPATQNQPEFIGEVKFYGGMADGKKIDAAVFANPTK